MHLSHCGSGVVLLSTLFLSASAYEKAGTGDVGPLSYVAGDKISITCLNRTIDTGEHVQDENTGVLQYIPFATCNETGRPLEVDFLQEGDLNCTIPFLTDEMFHLLEYYVHHDSPLACRVPVRPPGGERDLKKADEEYIPLVFALAGKLEASHIHLATNVNLLFHLPSPTAGSIDCATAYSTSPHTSLARVIIGDSLPLKIKLSWHPTPSPSLSFSDKKSGGGWRTLTYCLLSAGVGAGVAYAALLGWEFPRRLKRYTFDQRRGAGGGGIIGNFGGSGGGYGYSPAVAERGKAMGNGYGYSGKRVD